MSSRTQGKTEKRSSAEIKRGYIDRVRDAMELVGDEVAQGTADGDGAMTQDHYIEALEELSDDISGHLEAAREESSS